MTDHLQFPTLGDAATRVLAAAVEKINTRAEGRVLTQPELYDKRRAEHSLEELAALARARERCPEGRVDPLDLVLLQVEEIDKAGLSRDCLSPDDLQELARRGKLP